MGSYEHNGRRQVQILITWRGKDRTAWSTLSGLRDTCDSAQRTRQFKRGENFNTVVQARLPALPRMQGQPNELSTARWVGTYHLTVASTPDVLRCL